MLVVYEFENGDVMVVDGERDEKTLHINGNHKKTVYDSGVIIINQDLKIVEG